MSAEATILVKKADGSSVRMTLTEFKLYKSGGTKSSGDVEVASPVSQPINQPLQKQLPTVSAPVTKIFVDEAIAQKKTEEWKKEDHKSLLDDTALKLKSNEKIPNQLPIKPSGLLGKILENLKFPVKEDLFGRIESLAVSKLKDVRSDEQVLEYSVRSEKMGGLGLGQREAEELLSVIKNSLTPINNKTAVEISEKVTVKPLKENYSLKESKIINKDFGVKPFLHDVLPIQKVVEDKVSVGPIDEIRNFTLTDLRRLGNNPKVCVKVLQEKFNWIKSDSIISFFQAVTAWRESPLFFEYEKVLSDAIMDRKKVKEEIKEHNQLSWEEFLELTELNRELSL